MHRSYVELERHDGEKNCGEHGLVELLPVELVSPYLLVFRQLHLEEAVFPAQHVRIADFLPDRQHGLQRLLVAFHLHVGGYYLMTTHRGLEVQVELQPVGLLDAVRSLDLVFEVVLPEVHLVLGIEPHPLRLDGERPRHSRSHISSVGDEDYVWEVGMLHVQYDRVHRPGVRDVAGVCPVVDGHVLRQHVHHHLVRLLKRHPLLVVSPLDDGKRAAVGRAGCGVHGAQFLASDPCGAEPQELYPVALLDASCQMRDVGRRQRARGREPVHLLMAGKVGVGEVGDVGEQNIAYVMMSFTKSLLPSNTSSRSFLTLVLRAICSKNHVSP